MPTLRPFFIDTDTASDDAVALVMAFARKDINIVGIGVVGEGGGCAIGICNERTRVGVIALGGRQAGLHTI